MNFCAELRWGSGLVWSDDYVLCSSYVRVVAAIGYPLLIGLGVDLLFVDLSWFSASGR